MAEELSRRGHELHLFVPSCAERVFTSLEKTVNEVQVYKRDLWQPGFALLNPLRYKRYLKQVEDQERVIAGDIAGKEYDGIYTGQCRIWTEPPLLCFLPADLPKAHYCAEPKRSFFERRFLEQMIRWPWWKKLWRMATIRWMKESMHRNIAAANLVLCNSSFSKENIAAAYPGVLPQVSAIGTDTGFFHPLTDPTQKEMVLLSIGAIDPSKNHAMAVRVAGLRPGGRDFRVQVIGDRSHGETEADLKKLARELSVELEIRQNISRDELAEACRRSFCGLYCPLREPFGIASIEIQASATPVLGRAEGGLLETVAEGQSGYLLGDDPRDYAAKLALWLDDREEYARLCAGARENALQNWDREKKLRATAVQLEELFRKHKRR
ncbi:MAG: glycosyltransferase family 4 protein [Planctomycetes bacterium]|nr:glycosyltransferase family 4 protein [Planctomycetota bacterium]